MVALAIAGGGSGVIPRLLTRPGASRTVLEAAGAVWPPRAHGVAWSGAGDELLAGNLTRACAGRPISGRCGSARRCHVPVLGLGATARPGHRTVSEKAPTASTWRSSMAFSAGNRRSGCARTPARARAEEAIAEQVILGALAEAMVGGGIDIDLHSDERLQTGATALAHYRDVIAGGEQPWATVDHIDSRVSAGGALPGIVVPGSFNPLHEGHAALLEGRPPPIHRLRGLRNLHHERGQAGAWRRRARRAAGAVSRPGTSCAHPRPNVCRKGPPAAGHGVRGGRRTPPPASWNPATTAARRVSHRP